MTTSDWSKASDAEIDTEIARRIWKFNGHHWLHRRGSSVANLGERIYPSFVNNLDQVARAERTLRHPKRQVAYMVALGKATGGGVWNATTADARTRALAFLAATEARHV